MIELKDAIKRWKDLNIQRARFDFNCGGDCMGDTNLVFIGENGEFSDDELESYIDNEIYNEVEFYVNSDGYYLGESGSVYIELEDDEESFCYTKSATSEYSETKTNNVLVELTENEYNVLNEYVSSIGYSYWDGETIEFKKDFILTDEIETTITDIREKLMDYAENIEIGVGEDLQDDTLSYEVQEVEFVEKEGVKYLKAEVSCEVYTYRDDD